MQVIICRDVMRQATMLSKSRKLTASDAPARTAPSGGLQDATSLPQPHTVHDVPPCRAKHGRLPTVQAHLPGALQLLSPLSTPPPGTLFRHPAAHNSACANVMVTLLQGKALEVGPLNYLFMHVNEPGAYCLGVFDNGYQGTLLGGITFRNILVQVGHSWLLLVCPRFPNHS